jgi:hypothetical protein
VLSLQVLAERGVRMSAFLLEPGSFGGERASTAVSEALATAGIAASGIRRSDDLAVALGSMPHVGPRVDVVERQV